MINLDKQISNLIARQFPAVYREQGEQLVAFTQAYYEWLETNCQLLTVADATNFNVGDTVVQGPAGGEILARDRQNLLVLSTRLTIQAENGSGTNSETNSDSPDIIETFPPAANSITTQSTMDSQNSIGYGSTVLTNRIYDPVTERYTDKTIDYSGYTKALRGAETFACIRFCDSLENIKSSSGGSTKILAARNCSTTLLARSLPEYADIDLTLEKFIVHFKEKYLANIEFDVATNKRLLIKNALNLYRAKGTERAVDLLFKLVYGTEARVYTPAEDLFRLSDGQYIRPVYLEVTNSPVLVNAVGQRVRGVLSSASGFVERYIRRRVNNNFVYLLYISAVEGSFINQEPLSINGVYDYSYPRVVGSLNDFAIVVGGSGFNIGDTVSIVANTGSGGLARVSAVSERTGVVDFQLIDGGWGYTVNADCFVSEKVLTLSDVVVTNTGVSGSYLIPNEKFEQAKVTVQYDSATANLIVNDTIYFANSTSNTAVGTVIDSQPNTASTGTLLVSVTSGSVSAISASDLIYYSNNLLVANTTAVTDSTVGSVVTGVSNTAVLSIGTISSGATVTVGSTVTQSTGNGIITSVQQVGSTANIAIEITSGRFTIGQNITIGNTVTANVVNQYITVGVHNVNSTFSNQYSVSSNLSGLSATITNISTGSLAGFSIGSLGETETVFINTDLLAANNTSDVPYTSLALNATAYGFPKAPAGNSATVMFQCLNFDDFNLGTIASLTGINPGADYNVDPLVRVQQPYISGFGRKDLIINISDPTSSFTIGERIVQTNANLTFIALGVADSTGFTIGENIYQGTLPSQTANGIISSLSATSIVVKSVQGTFNSGANVFSRISSANVSVANTETLSVVSTAKAIIKTANSTVITAKRIQFENTWTSGTLLVGQSSGATANVVSVTEQVDSLPIGLNAVVSANVVTASGTVTSLDVIDSGFGYANGQLASFISSDGTRSGNIFLIREGQGLAVGYWRSNKGMLSSDKYLLDSDFYQEYSYQVISRIPFDKYKSMVLDVLHVAGTKLFGAVEIDSNANPTITHIESSITQS